MGVGLSQSLLGGAEPSPPGRGFCVSVPGGGCSISIKKVWLGFDRGIEMFHHDVSCEEGKLF